MYEEKGETTKLELTDAYGTYTIEVNEVDLTMEGLVRLLIVPVLSAASYQPGTINAFFGEEMIYEEECDGYYDEFDDGEEDDEEDEW